MLDTKYFLDLLQFVGVTSKEQTKASRQKNLDNRRKAYKAQDWEEYERIVKDTITQEDQACQFILKEVIDALGISEQEFGMTHQTLAANPQTAEFVMLAQQGKFEQKEPKAPKLEKKKTLDVFETSK